MTISVDLGSGPVPKNPFNADEAWGVDIVNFEGGYYADKLKVADLAHDLIPFVGESVDYVVATDFLEHIPRTGYRVKKHSSILGDPIIEPFNPFLHVMSEIWRVLKPGGKTLFKTPAFPHGEAFQDPTHVNIITEKTVSYFIIDKHEFHMPTEPFSHNCSTTEFPGSMLGLGRAYGFKGQFELLTQYWENYWLVWELKKVGKG